jgi:hypothetical protein
MTNRRQFLVNGEDILYVKTDTWKLKQALREANQKRLKNASQIMKLKKRQSFMDETGRKCWTCPMCLKKAKRLTVAHIGTRASDIIDKVLSDHSQTKDAKNFLYLDECVRTHHNRVKLAICCDKCNEKYERKKLHASVKK